ncbi:GDSL-like Lipase/Acylhydrolase superfamily protein [Striga asiatica]|uniref:GDSL-like Lipase/Acylhydrolase superfamily protein n=1 Tax=Striga asiatica TaxID=4170 RepID=A0A5A7R3S6_STRAF|nr:GDSL-like Lipase/Acylhydrolase superfamily protein [Striga asiatica]
MLSWQQQPPASPRPPSPGRSCKARLDMDFLKLKWQLWMALLGLLKKARAEGGPAVVGGHWIYVLNEKRGSESKNKNKKTNDSLARQNMLDYAFVFLPYLQWLMSRTKMSFGTKR